MKREIMAACAALLLAACEGSNEQTLEVDTATPRLRRVDAATQKKIDTLREKLDHHRDTDPSSTPTPSPRDW